MTWIIGSRDGRFSVMGGPQVYYLSSEQPPGQSWSVHRTGLDRTWSTEAGPNRLFRNLDYVLGPCSMVLFTQR